MRIAVYHELPSGGAKRALFETVRRLAERHIVDVFTVTGADHDFCDLRPFVHAYRLANFFVASGRACAAGGLCAVVAAALV